MLKKIITSILFILIIGFSFILLMFPDVLNLSNLYHTGHIMTNVEQLVINLEEIDLQIIPSNNANQELMIDGAIDKNRKLKIEKNGTKVMVTEELLPVVNQKKSIDLFKQQNQLTISAPNQLLEQVTIVNTNGEVDINVDIPELDVSTVNNDVEIGSVITKLDANLVNGDLAMNVNNGGSLGIKSVNGDIELAICRECGYRMQVNAGNGELDDELTNLYQSIRREPSNYLYQSGVIKIEINAQNGDIEIDELK